MSDPDVPRIKSRKCAPNEALVNLVIPAASPSETIKPDIQAALCLSANHSPEKIRKTKSKQLQLIPNQTFTCIWFKSELKKKEKKPSV